MSLPPKFVARGRYGERVWSASCPLCRRKVSMQAFFAPAAKSTRHSSTEADNPSLIEGKVLLIIIDIFDFGPTPQQVHLGRYPSPPDHFRHPEPTNGF